jgi:hypothetical protein
LIYTQEGGPLGCSEEDWKSSIARQMIGVAVRDQRMWAPLTMTDPYRGLSTTETRGYTLVKREKATKKLIRTFTRNAGEQNKRRAAAMQDKTFDVVFEFYPHINRAVTARKTALAGRQAWHDVYEAIAEFVQEKHSAFTSGKTSVKDQKLRTRKDVADHKAKLLKAVTDSYKGTKSNLVRATHFVIILYDKRQPSFRPIYHRHYGNMQQGIHQAARDISNWLPTQRHLDFEFLVVSRYGGPHYCSKGDDMTDKDCARMYGYAL